MRRSDATSPNPSGRGDPRRPRGNFTPPPTQGGDTAFGDQDADPPQPDPPPSGRFSPRNWRVATKLYAILLIPVVVALILGGMRVTSAYQTSREANDAERTAELVRAATGYAHALIDERDVTAAPLLKGDRDDPAVDAARRTTDAAREEFWAAVRRAPDVDSLNRRIDQVREAQGNLERLRQVAYSDRAEGVETEEGYVALQHPLMSLANELRLGTTTNITSFGRTIYALSLSKSASSLQRAIGTHLLLAPGPDDAQLTRQLTAFSSYAYLEDVALSEFSSAGTPQDGELLSDAMARAASEASAQASDAPELDRMVQLIASGTAPEELAEQGVTPETWFTVATTEFDAYRSVEEQLVEQAVTEAGEIAAGARRDMAVNSAAVLGSLLLAFVVAGLMARSMSRNMRRLRGTAIEVAEQRLPAVVDQLSRTDPGRVDTRVAPIPINSRDEFGEVARAFDQVHREAVRLAGEQALLRGNVNAICTNLSARNQGLIERQLSLIGELENHEADPEQLENLFKLDHLATRMRRNGENLLVLAGKEPDRRWNQPVPLIDALRGAASEVEAYDRIEISGIPECEIHGEVVNDLVHLLAELLENATSFSSPHTRVRVAATRLPDGRVMIEIHDKGIGLTPEDFAEINSRLANPPAVDADVSRRMGLYVVGRLAERHGIRVQLRPSGEQTGTTSLVMLPEAITRGGGGAPEQEEEFTVSRIMSEGPHAAEVPETESRRIQRVRTAAELGFDDSRYADAADQQAPAAAPEPAAAGGSPGDTLEFGGPVGTAGGTERDPFDYGGAAGYDQEPVFGQPPAQQAGFGAFPSYEGPYTESSHGGPTDDSQRVGFTGSSTGSGPVAAEYRSTTSAGLPRREPPSQRREEDPSRRPREEAAFSMTPGQAQWDRGPRREEHTGGVTAAGLPRRVPRANLAPQTPPESASGGAQVSRHPDDVRGRLSSLRRGVQQGRGAGGRRGTQNDDQER